MFGFRGTVAVGLSGVRARKNNMIDIRLNRNNVHRDLVRFAMRKRKSKGWDPPAIHTRHFPRPPPALRTRVCFYVCWAREMGIHIYDPPATSPLPFTLPLPRGLEFPPTYTARIPTWDRFTSRQIMQRSACNSNNTLPIFYDLGLFTSNFKDGVNIGG